MNKIEKDIDCNFRNLFNGIFQGTFKSSDDSNGLSGNQNIYSFSTATQYTGSYTYQTVTYKNGLIV